MLFNLKNFFRGYFFFFIIILSPNLLEAQIFDSLYHKLKSTPKFLFKFDTRNSFISSRSAVFSGFKLGFKYDNSLTIGIGISFLNSDVVLKNTSFNENSFPETAFSKLTFNYISPFLEYVFYKDNKWEHAIPLQFGFGYSNFRFIDNFGLNRILFNKPIVLYEPAMTTEYKLFPWLAIGGGLGYRLLLINNKIYGKLFNSPVYLIKFNVVWGNISYKVFDKKKPDN